MFKLNARTRHAATVLCLSLFLCRSAHGTGLNRLRFQVVDPKTHKSVSEAQVTIEDPRGEHLPYVLNVGAVVAGQVQCFDVRAWAVTAESRSMRSTLVTVPLGVVVQLQTPAAPPVKEIKIVVRASVLRRPAQATSSGTVRTQSDIQKFAGSQAGKGNGLVNNTAGASSDSAGQQHVRGEHAELAYIVDGVMLPDTLSGRQGAIVVPSTIESLDILTGGFAPEYGGQTAAILDITTKPRSEKPQVDLNILGGSYDSTSGDLTGSGPLGRKAGYVFNISATRTGNYLEPQQPDNQTAHNAGAALNFFTKFRYTPTRKDTLALTMNQAPTTAQVGNRTGLPASFALAGQGYGFLGLRDADGSIPAAVAINPGGLGSQSMVLPSQQTDGMDITQREVNEYATLAWQHRFSIRDTSLLGLTLLHSGQDVHNHNPTANVLGLPVDNSIEYNPTVGRNVHHVQITGTVTASRRLHQVKAGLLLDDQNGNEAYEVVPASQLALDELASYAPSLAPAGADQLSSGGKPVLDVNGNPVYVATSAASPVLKIHRSGFYRAAYLQDSWKIQRLSVNYGLRGDWYRQEENLGQGLVDTADLSPRINFAYRLNRLTMARWSYDRLFNIPPLAQGAIVGAPIQPETLNQYDVSLERDLGRGQDVKLAYYIKDIRNQVDTGLLIPGSEMGIYSAVNFQVGGVHGVELTYDVTPPKGIGLDGFVNYTYSIAAPSGLDSTGAPAPQFNDHDQRNAVGLGVAYSWKSGPSVSYTLQYGSGLASSIVPPGTTRTPRATMNVNATSGSRIFRGRGGITLSIENLLDERSVINFESGFSGTRFMQGRQIMFSAFGNF